MIISRAPLRISLLGGGSDVPAYYSRHGGACLSFAIQKYVYVSVNEKFDGATRVSYSKTENVQNPCDLEHDLVRESLALYNERGLEITSVSDIPGSGTGLGSSSSFTVALLASLSGRIRHGTPYPPSMLSEMAFTVEANMCGHPTGKQDQYAAAYGGFHLYKFLQDGKVSVQPIPILPDDGKDYLERHLMLFWTGISRSANEILKSQEARLKYQEKSAMDAVQRSAYMACKMFERFQDGKYHHLGAALHEAWELKKQYTSGITSTEIDCLYNTAIRAGAVGGKLCGAGGGGFFLFFVPESKQERVKQELKLRHVPFKIEMDGVKVVYHD